MEEPAVEHGLEFLAPVHQTKGVCDDKARLEASVGRLGLGHLDGLPRQVGADPLMTE